MIGRCCPFGSVYISHKQCLKYELVSLPFKMDTKTSMRIIIIAMLLFLFLSSAMVFAKPDNVAPEASEFIIWWPLYYTGFRFMQLTNFLCLQRRIVACDVLSFRRKLLGSFRNKLLYHLAQFVQVNAARGHNIRNAFKVIASNLPLGNKLISKIHDSRWGSINIILYIVFGIPSHCKL